MTRVLVCGTIVVFSCFGQSFEVASVRPNQSGDTHSDFSISGGQEGAKLNVQNVNLVTLIQRAYGVRQYQIAGPDWLKDVRFDIVAALPADTPKDKLMPALQALLTERFKLSFHRETKELPVYALLVAKGGPKISASANPDGQSGTWQGRGQYTAKNENIANFCDVLSRNVGRPVLDITGLAGPFDFAIEYAPDDGRSTTDPAAASLFTAIQEKLGLKLESRKGPVELLVIDAVRKTPTEN